MRELESDGRAAALQRTPAFVELAAVELEGYLSFRCFTDTVRLKAYLLCRKHVLPRSPVPVCGPPSHAALWILLSANVLMLLLS